MESVEKYKEIICKIEDLKDGDQVMGSDGKWHDIEILPSFTPKDMYKIFFFKADSSYNVEFLGFESDNVDSSQSILKIDNDSNDDNNFKTFIFKDDFEDHKPVFSITGEIIGTIECSGTHEWSILDIGNNIKVLNTRHIFEKLPFIFGCHVGNQYGPFIGFIKKVTPKPCKCIKLKDSDDHLFEVLLNTPNTPNKNIKKQFFEVIEN